MSIRSSLLGLLVTASVAAGGVAPASAGGDSHSAWVRAEMHQVRTGDYTYKVDMIDARLIPRFDRYANHLRRTRNPRDLMFPDPRPQAYKQRRW
jgi:hypothetical protein